MLNKRHMDRKRVCYRIQIQHLLMLNDDGGVDVLDLTVFKYNTC